MVSQTIVGRHCMAWKDTLVVAILLHLHLPSWFSVKTSITHIVLQDITRRGNCQFPCIATVDDERVRACQRSRVLLLVPAASGRYSSREEKRRLGAHVKIWL